MSAPFPGSLTAGSSPALFAREVEALVREGIAPQRATEAIDAQVEISSTQLIPKLLAALGSTYGGVWFEDVQARLHIGVVSPTARRAADATVARAGVTNDVILTAVHSTWDQLVIAQTQWNRRLASLFAHAEVETSIAPQDNAVFVTLSSSVSPPKRAAIEREASIGKVRTFVAATSARRLTIEREASTSCNIFSRERRALCNKPLTAGVYIESPRKICTAGPLATSRRDKQFTWILTAGHCISRSGRRARWSSINRAGVTSEIGLDAQSVFSARGDIGAIRVTNASWLEPGDTPVFAVTAEWAKNEEESFAVQGQRTPEVGEENCVEGQVSGGLCGRIRSTTATFRYGFTITDVVEEEGVSTMEGDSGGPVIAATKGGYLAEGTVIGSRSTRPFNTVYEPLETAFTVLSNLHLELLTTSNETRPRESEEEKTEGALIEKYEEAERNITEAEQKEEEEHGLKEEEEEIKQRKEEREKQEKEEHFTATGLHSTLKAGPNAISCGKDTSSGELNSTMLFGDVVIHYLECKSSGSGGSNCSVKSTNTTSEGLIVTNTLQAILGLALPSRAAGLLLLPTSGKTWETLAANTCTAETKVTGTIAGLITPTGKSEKTSKVTFSTASGKQEINDIVTLAGLIKPELTAFSVGATEEATEELTWGKEVEIP